MRHAQEAAGDTGTRKHPVRPAAGLSLGFRPHSVKAQERQKGSFLWRENVRRCAQCHSNLDGGRPNSIQTSRDRYLRYLKKAGLLPKSRICIDRSICQNPRLWYPQVLHLSSQMVRCEDVTTNAASAPRQAMRWRFWGTPSSILPTNLSMRAGRSRPTTGRSRRFSC